MTICDPRVKSLQPISDPASAKETPTSYRQAPSRSAHGVFWFCIVTLFGNIGFGFVTDYGPVQFRDPEYGQRLEDLKRHIQQHPCRPLVLVVGSSRTAMGIRPDCIDDVSKPLLFNFSLAGAGPITQLLILKRVEHEQITPSKIFLEYWPPFMRGDACYAEDLRIDPLRLRPEDADVVRAFFPDPDSKLSRRDRSSWTPFYSLRKPLLDRFAPGWLPHAERADAMFANLDRWGWLPGWKETTAEMRDKGWPHVQKFYRPLFQGFTVDSRQDRALQSCIDHCKRSNIEVTLLVMPESRRFQTLKTTSAIDQSNRHLAGVCTNTQIQCIDTTEWFQDDESLPDGFHLTQPAAERFTKRFAGLANTIRAKQ